MAGSDPLSAQSYRYSDAGEVHMHALLWPVVLAQLKALNPTRILDLGSGNGYLAARLKAAFPDAEVFGIDPSESGVTQACAAHPEVHFQKGSVYEEPPAEMLNSMDVVVCTEVVEHLYAPRSLPTFIHKVLKKSGRALVTTPYHGYLKNLAICLAGKWDHHHSPLWDHGHVKFWSRTTLDELFAEGGFRSTTFKGIGRFPGLWMTMLMVFRPE